MAERKKISHNKPPVPARPKNLIVFNSKSLPKPPETFLADSVTNFIKDLNLDIKDEAADIPLEKSKNLDYVKNDNTFNSDGEEDTYGYLEPVALPLDSTDAKGNKKWDTLQKKSYQEDNGKLGEVFQKLMSNNSPSSENNLNGLKPQITQNQWQRPLPLPPISVESQVTRMPWYKNVDRTKGEEILKNGVDGYFFVRPSSNANAYLTLTLWYGNRVYNIPIRKRKDGKFALGTQKINEQCFDSVESLVRNYQSEKLVLFSHGVQSGKTLLTTFPP